jgi:hypothetical protein
MGRRDKHGGQTQVGSEELQGAALHGANLSIPESHDWFPFLKGKITLHISEWDVKHACQCVRIPFQP